MTQPQPAPAVWNYGDPLMEAIRYLEADMERFFAEWPDEPRNSPYALGRKDVIDELRRLAAASAVVVRRATDETQGEARPRCPHCQLPHDLEADSTAVAACASIRASIASGTQAADEPQFGVPGCTCRPWTRQEDPPRYLDQPGDTVDMISGWEIGSDCPHHKPAVGAQQAKETRP